MSILYDTAADVVMKALRGTGMTAEEACEGTDIDADQLIQLIRNEAPSPSFRPVAARLGLDPNALEQFDQPWLPIEEPQGLRRIELPFEDETVNIWVLEHAEKSLIIDAGFQSSDLPSVTGLPAEYDLLVTHAHRDHIGALSQLAPRSAKAFSPSQLPGCEIVTPGQELRRGPWSIEVADLAGHHPQAVGYRIRGMDQEFAAVGDAVFARSAGGCPDTEAYQSAKTTAVNFWKKLDPSCLLLTGHGPMTQVAREEQENPFIKGWLQATKP